MGNGNKKFTSNSFSANDLEKRSSKSTNNKDVAKWSSAEVQHWIKQQCKKFELKKATAEKFEINGQALVLLNKHDFLRRSPDGGEVLYYALQRLINPNKANAARVDQTSLRNGSSGQHPRIVEVSVDSDEFNGATDSSSTKPIIEEPDDPPIIRRSQSDTQHNNYQQQQRRHPFFFSQANIRPAVVTMSAGGAAVYFHQQQQGFPNAFMYAHHHPHLHMHQQPFFRPYLIHQYHPMMAAQGILIEIMDDADLSNYTPDGVNGPMNGANFGAQESLYMVTINGQRYIMNEGQVRQLVTEVHQHQTYQENLQQQRFQQQQQQFQQQQQHYQQQQQHFQQQRQQHFQQQPQQQQHFQQQPQQQQHFQQQQPQHFQQQPQQQQHFQQQPQQQQHFQQQQQQQPQHFQQQQQRPFPEQQRF